VFRALLQFLRFLRIPTFITGRAEYRRLDRNPARRGQFASFMSVQKCSRRHHPDRHDRRLQLNKFARAATTLAAIAAAAWIAVESARALSVF
jgi:hypothetical protein